jgi:hypothetical protein
MKKWGKMFPPNTDANTGENPAYYYANLTAGLKHEWKEYSKDSCSFITIMAHRTGADYCEIS